MKIRLWEIFGAWVLAACYAFLWLCAFIFIANVIIGSLR